MLLLSFVTVWVVGGIIDILQDYKDFVAFCCLEHSGLSFLLLCFDKDKTPKLQKKIGFKSVWNKFFILK